MSQVSKPFAFLSSYLTLQQSRDVGGISLHLSFRWRALSGVRMTWLTEGRIASQLGRAVSLSSSASQILFVLHLEKSDLKHRCFVGGMKHVLQCQKITGHKSRKQDICFCYNMTENKALAAWDWAFTEETGSRLIWATLLLERCIWFWATHYQAHGNQLDEVQSKAPKWLRGWWHWLIRKD